LPPSAAEVFTPPRRDSGLPVRRNEVASRRLARVRPDRRSLGRPRMKPPRQAELDLNPEAPPPPVVVGGADLARTIAELRARGFQVWAMDVRRATYTLHLHRSMTPSKNNFFQTSRKAGYAGPHSSCVTRPAEITSKSESTPGHHESIDPERIHACRSGWSQHTGNPAAWRVWSYPARRARQVSDHRDTASLVQTLPAPPRSAG